MSKKLNYQMDYSSVNLNHSRSYLHSPEFNISAFSAPFCNTPEHWKQHTRKLKAIEKTIKFPGFKTKIILLILSLGAIV